MCASPERFIKKKGSTIISQPIKGTANRIKNDVEADEQRKDNLLHNDKERSENIMIVDLVRNDLSKICTQGFSFSKRIPENLFISAGASNDIYHLPEILKENISLADIFYATFPMGFYDRSS